MKQVISGRLAKTPELKNITFEDGSESKVCNFIIFAYDPQAPTVEGKPYKKGIPLKCTAWGENAIAVSEMEEGSTLTASATQRLNEYVIKNKDGQEERTVSESVYVIKRIDPDNEIQKQMNELLRGYEEKKYDILYQNDVDQPAFQPSRDKNPLEKTAEIEKSEDKEI